MVPSAIKLVPRFATTNWAVIRTAAGQDRAARQALERLCRDYWYPIYFYLRKLGYGRDAEDLTQDFLADILERPWVARADQSKGKFRAFLLGSLRLFLGDATDKDHALKRQGSHPHFHLDTSDAESWYARSRSASIGAPLSYEIEWARTVVANATKRLELEYARTEKQDHFSVLRDFLKGEGNADSYELAATAMKTTVNNVKVRVHRLRRSYGALLRQELARTVDSPAEIDEEMQHLRSVFSMASS